MGTVDDVHHRPSGAAGALLALSVAVGACSRPAGLRSAGDDFTHYLPVPRRQPRLRGRGAARAEETPYLQDADKSDRRSTGISRGIAKGLRKPCTMNMERRGHGAHRQKSG